MYFCTLPLIKSICLKGFFPPHRQPTVFCILTSPVVMGKVNSKPLNHFPKSVAMAKFSCPTLQKRHIPARHRAQLAVYFSSLIIMELDSVCWLRSVQWCYFVWVHFSQYASHHEKKLGSWIYWITTGLTGCFFFFLQTNFWQIYCFASSASSAVSLESLLVKVTKEKLSSYRNYRAKYTVYDPS